MGAVAEKWREKACSRSRWFEAVLKAVLAEA